MKQFISEMEKNSEIKHDKGFKLQKNEITLKPIQIKDINLFKKSLDK